jgi:hypothetical protein
VEDLIPIIAILCTIGLPVCSFMLFRVLKHRERMEMIRHGLAPDGSAAGWSAPPPPRAPNWSGPPPPDAMSMGRRGKRNCRDSGELEAPYITLRKGIRLAMIGIAVTIGISFVGFDDGSIRPGPWLLFGFVPLFVGLSQIILALLSGASLTPVQQQWSAGQPQPPPQFGGSAPGPAPSQQVYDTSYTYRPGDVQELQPPASPPERR